ncbi:MAG: hypothetical protein WC702_01940 [Patescibacteria group bacterium]
MKETLLAVVKSINATNQSNQAAVNETTVSSTGSFFASSSMLPMEFVFRSLRVAAVFFGLLFLLTILQGAFKYIVSSGRDETVSKSRRMIVTGGIGVVVMIFLYILASSWLINLLAT